ncbi:hypothetical protein D9613_004196 [Agrocybe pediades]|uniref:Uncharacterized protein n=1 Tax=Agrocybe pediades TaxID=84607 RepID=A0A8H4QJR0_9AGAR|nr:hypothetical protein D9613_004196 [Agrocybe pediades]
MAKPLPVASSDCPGASNSSSITSNSRLSSAHRPPHRRHRKFAHPGPRPTPSSGILILLASLAASAPTVNGSPAPLPFLCPSVGTERTVSIPPVRRNSQSSASTSTSHAIVSKATQRPSFAAPRHVPDRFSQGPDGVWRRVGSYTLYGSTVSACVGQSCRTPTNAVSNVDVDVDDQIQVGSNQIVSNGSSPPYDFRDTLPPGWKPTSKPYESKTPLILAMSLVLACIICFFIFGCLFWRRTMRKHYKSHDVEAKARKKRRAIMEEESRESVVEKEVKAKQKIWARATARWKANVRYSARQRRKRFGTRSSQAHQSSYSVDTAQSQVAGLHSPTHSRMSSRVSSTVSIPDQLQEDNAQDYEIPSPAVITTTPSPSSPQSAPLALPPAYQHRGQIPPIVVSTDGTSSEEYSESPDFGRTRRPSHSSYTGSVVTNDGQTVGLSPNSAVHAAHLATDDKTLLAHLANMASQPPEDRTPQSAETSHTHVSAPVWDDEEMESIPLHLISPAPSQSTSTQSTMFPPPPSKERLAASEYYRYPFSFDELESIEVDSGPSAPPFEEDARPQNSNLLLPSAPPLLDHEEYVSQQPSAPELDSLTQNGSPEEHPTGQDHDRIALPQGPSVVSSSTLRPNPTNDTITLPGYRP